MRICLSCFSIFVDFTFFVRRKNYRGHSYVQRNFLEENPEHKENNSFQGDAMGQGSAFLVDDMVSKDNERVIIHHLASVNFFILHLCTRVSNTYIISR